MPSRTSQTLLRAVWMPLLAVSIAGCLSRYSPTDTAGDGLLPVEELSSVNLHATSVQVQWEVRAPTRARLRYGIDSVRENLVYSSDEPSTDHLVRMHFLRPDTEYIFRVELLEDGEPVGHESGTFTTPPIPDELPEFDIEVDELGEHGLIAASVMGDSKAAVVLSQEGHYVWWQVEENQQLTIAQVRMGPDGESIYYHAYDKGESEDEDAIYEMRKVSLEDGSVETFDIRFNHHDFWVHDDGTVAWIRGENLKVAGRTYRGDSIVETDPDGNETQLWSSWDHLRFDMSAACNSSESHIWTHANALYYDADRDMYLLSLRETDSVVAVERSTGDTAWILGGCESDFRFPEATRFHGQHQIQSTEHGLLVYDNRPDDKYSRVAEYTLDFEEGEVTEVWSYEGEQAYSTNVLGDAQRLSSGNTLVTWSTAAVMDEVDPDGQLLWQASFGFGTVLGYNTLIE